MTDVVLDPQRALNIEARNIVLTALLWKALRCLDAQRMSVECRTIAAEIRLALGH